VHCQSDRERELISRPELRPSDRHADEEKADATETAVTGHLRPTFPYRPPSPSLHVGQFVAILVEKASTRYRLTVDYSPAVWRNRAVTYLEATPTGPTLFGRSAEVASTARREIGQCREAYSKCL